jgi:ATP-dependent exoDNAse (exonuclease V) beta subunit
MDTEAAVKRKRETPPTFQNASHIKKAKVDNSSSTDVADLLQLLDFSALDKPSDISDRFDRVANALLHNYVLVVRCGKVETEFRILELEFYLQKSECHEDPFTHGSEEQKICGRWCVVHFPSLAKSPHSKNIFLLSLGTSTAHQDHLQILTVV